MSRMIPFEEAESIVLATARLLGREEVPLGDSLHRILADDVRADRDQPPFDKAAMDGFACRRADLPGPLAVLETVAAGSMATRAVGPGQCTRIMTGAPVPDGADCVIRFEDTVVDAENTVRAITTETAGNICRRGEDARIGDVVARRGACIAPQHVAVLAGVGLVTVPVARRPRVAVLGTGDELVEPALSPGPGQIRNSNSPQLVAQALAAGAEPTYLGIAPDTVEDIGDALGRALADHDVVLISGGVSQGDFDFVPQAMRRNGLEILFDRVAVKPGRPTTFAHRPGRWCFGLAGNPVSTFLLCEILVKPLLWRLMGRERGGPAIPARLEAPFFRRKADRQAWLPVVLTADGMARALEYHGSAHINALCLADGFVVIPAGTSHLPEGALVHVRPLPAPH